MRKLLQIFESVLFWAVLTLLIFIPLYLKFPLFGVGGTFVSIRLEDVLIAATYLLWGIYLVLSGKIKEFFKDKLNQVFLAFFLIGAISTFSAVFLTKTATLTLGILHLARRIEVIMLLPLLVSVIRQKRQAYVYLGVLSIVAFIVAFYAFGQRYLSFPAISTTNSELSKGFVYYIQPYDRVISTFGGHYDLAVFLVMSLTIISATIFYFLKKNKIYAVWAAILALASTVVLVMTAARLSFVAAIVGIIAALILAGRKKFIFLILILAGLALIYPSQLRDRFISTFTVNIKNSWQSYFGNDAEKKSKLNIPTLPIYGPITIEKVATDEAKTNEQQPADIVPGEPVDITDLGVYRSLEIRIRAEWPRAIRAFIKNPILGTGYSSIGLATDNDLLRSLGEVGILGTYAFILVLIEVVKRIVGIYKTRKGFVKYFSAGILAMILAFLVNGLFIDVFEASKTASLFWMILGINLALGRLDTREAKNA